MVVQCLPPPKATMDCLVSHQQGQLMHVHLVLPLHCCHLPQFKTKPHSSELLHGNLHLIVGFVSGHVHWCACNTAGGLNVLDKRSMRPSIPKCTQYQNSTPEQSGRAQTHTLFMECLGVSQMPRNASHDVWLWFLSIVGSYPRVMQSS